MHFWYCILGFGSDTFFYTLDTVKSIKNLETDKLGDRL